MALDGMEKTLKEEPTLRGKKVNLIRYADDFVITGESKELLENNVKPLVVAFLQKRGLRLSEEKTRVTHIKEGFDFLGQSVRKYKNGKLLIKPSKESCTRFYKKLKQTIKQHRASKQEVLIMQLNPLLRGWGGYHRHVVAKETCSKMDHQLYWAVASWTKWRHPNKGDRWCKARYYKKTAKGEVFTTTVDAEGGKKQTYTLLKLVSIPSRRHIQIRSKANPYDPPWRPYIVARKKRRMRERLWERKRQLALKAWLAQEGKCRTCQEIIEETDQWHLHHLKPRKEGGPDILSNLAMVHPDCHRQIHSCGTAGLPIDQGGLRTA
jgi:RNA-directed DNA polymerase